MNWSDDADQAIKKVPFFVRKKVRKKVEAFVQQKGKHRVELADVNALKKQFLSKGGMEKHIKGFEISSCFGNTGCPNVACSSTQLIADIEDIFKKADLLSFLKKSIKGDLKFHHEFRVVVADCPNACSRPQIADIGIIGSALPGLSEDPCTLCNTCVNVCKENAVTLDEDNEIPGIDFQKCLVCGKCIHECPTGTLKEDQAGFRVQLGGKLGRHPRLAMEIPGLKSHNDVLSIVEKALTFYKDNSKSGQRFSQLLSSVDQVLEIAD
ncbi:MAG: 4Fe-4S dicluster domain-containing protein [Mesoflavibacter sp.]|nr:4Fe-4S dicluster domain-containing protein [Mesoflavibacter sp.]